MLGTHDIFKQELSKNSSLHQMTPEETERMQHTVLSIAKDVTDLCNRHGIPYTLGGGTALGAIRHRGFIPWDDDIDLNIESRYLESFYSYMEQELGDKYTLSIPAVTEGYYSTFVQVNKRGTICREDQHMPDVLSCIKIDIFPFVATYDDPVRRTMHGLLCDGGSFLLSCMRMRLFHQEYMKLAGNNTKAKLAIGIKSFLGFLPARMPQFFLRLVYGWHLMCKNEASRYVTCPSGRAHFKRELRKRRGFEERISVPFEDTQLAVSRDVKSYMRHLYGEDYMTLPPEEKRERHVIYQLDFGD